MRGYPLLAPLFALLFATAVAAEDFDGSKPMECTAIKGHDCLPDKNSCSRIKPEGKKMPVLGIDVAAKQVRAPFRTDLLPIGNVTSNEESLVLQGTNLQFAWSAVIKRSTGDMTLTIGDRKGAYVIFAQCAVAAPPQP